ncbi:hypothetical protein ATKI12_8181 [Kitasatospora sp. Ki12]
MEGTPFPGRTIQLPVKPSSNAAHAPAGVRTGVARVPLSARCAVPRSLKTFGTYPVEGNFRGFQSAGRIRSSRASGKC